MIAADRPPGVAARGAFLASRDLSRGGRTGRLQERERVLCEQQNKQILAEIESTGLIEPSTRLRLETPDR